MHALAWAVLAIVLLSGRAVAQDQPWPEEFYNRTPAEGDLVLTIPCGGAITFRPVLTPVPEGSALADRPLRLGRADASTGYVDYIRRTHLLGSLKGERGHWLYYIGKYEVTVNQYKAVMDGECAPATPLGTFPVSGISWFDAVTFTRRLTEWINANDPDALPSIGTARAFLRLPTEAEWEYAARGGAEVAEAAFRAERFPMDGPLVDYVLHQGPQSANGRLRPVGLLKPNPLQLYDMLGSVEEFVFEPFHFNRVGRTHGQVGGFMTKGGSILTGESEIRSSLRQEYGFFSKLDGKALALDTFGFRPVLATMLGTSDERVSALEAAWQKEAHIERRGAEDALKVVQRLREQTTDLVWQSELGALGELIASERRERVEVEGRAVRLSLLNGGLLVRTLIEDQSRVQGLRRLAQLIETQMTSTGQSSGEADAEVLERLNDARSRLDRADDRRTTTLRAFTETLFQIADDYPDADLDAQATTLKDELARTGQEGLSPYVGRFVAAVEDYRADPSLSANELMARAIADTR